MGNLLVEGAQFSLIILLKPAHIDQLFVNELEGGEYLLRFVLMDLALFSCGDLFVYGGGGFMNPGVV